MGTIATLGPAGTDAEAMAKKLTDNIVLCESFEAAMDYAKKHGTQALVACGYKEIRNGHVVDSWVDLHFRNYGHMEVVNTYCEDTKEMCIAKRRDCEIPKSLVIHPATKAFASLAPWPELDIAYVNAKPKAAAEVAAGKYDSCIASKDVVDTHKELEIVKVFKPQMVWALYERI